jgi:hypothetical protein
MSPFLANVVFNDFKAIILKCTKAPFRQTSKCYTERRDKKVDVITEDDLLTSSTKVVKLVDAKF